MDQRVWKWQLEPGENLLQMPKGAIVLSVIEQNGVVLYAAIEHHETEVEPRSFFVAMTGESFDYDFPAQSEFVGTVRLPGNYVAHVFETTAVMVVADADA